MALQVIGAGWGRTGTESLKEALEVLGFDRCYHMFELLRRTRQVPHWEALFRGEPTDLDVLFTGFRSAVDFPAARFYKEFADAYPEAKVVLTVRDPDAWYRSASATILQPPPATLKWATRILGVASPNLRGAPRLIQVIEDGLLNGLFEGRTQDAEFMKARFVAWNEEVKATIPAHRLLVYEVRDGWEPLCAFLGVPVPDRPFPRNNDGDSFQERLKLRRVIREFWSGADP